MASLSALLPYIYFRKLCSSRCLFQPTSLAVTSVQQAGGCAATDTGHSGWDVTQLLRHQRGQLQFSGWVLSFSVQELGSKFRYLSVLSFGGVLGALPNILSADTALQPLPWALKQQREQGKQEAGCCSELCPSNAVG